MSANGNGNTPYDADASAAPRSRADLVAIAEKEAQGLLGVRLDDAFAMIDRGDLEGTAVEAEFRMLRFLLAA